MVAGNAFQQSKVTVFTIRDIDQRGNRGSIKIASDLRLLLSALTVWSKFKRRLDIQSNFQRRTL